jgi:threonyl-tRNA synthetase
MIVGEKINLLGNKFRGLWRSKLVKGGKIVEEGWAVTFDFQGDIVETDYLKTPEQALDIAIETLKLERDD